MNRLLRSLLLGASTLYLPAAANAADGLSIVLAIHGSTSNAFFQAVRLGFEDACARVEADCQMLFAQTDGAIPEHVANLQAAIARAPDAIITTIIDDHAYDEVLDQARAAGITVIATNVDDTEGAAGNARQAFIGQDFVAAGYSLARGLAENFPAEGPLSILIGVSLPGANFAEKRAAGIEKFLDEYRTAHPEREITVERIDSGIDPAVTADRVGAALNANPDLDAYFDIVNNDAAVARVLRDRGQEPGRVLLAGFDLVPQVVQELQSGYIQVQVDQQPYMQGFLPVMMAYLAAKAGLAPADVNTGDALVFPADAEALFDLSRQGLR